MENLIEVRGLSKRFGHLLAVDNVSLDVKRGEVLGFLGPNGAGKSTTMKMVTGFLAPSAGEIRICGYDVASEPIRAKEKIGYLPEGAPAYGEMTPASFLDFIADIRGLQGAAKKARIDEVVAKIHLEEVFYQPIDTLSKGFKRRVGIAQAILHDPEVLIMDEPTDGLDPNQKYEVRELIKDMAETKAIVISTHILEEVGAVCTNAIIIAHGRLVFSGTPAELSAKSRYFNAVTIAIASEQADNIQAEIESIDGVDEVETMTSNGVTRLTALPKDRAVIASLIQDRAREKAWQINELFVEAGRLEEVFRSITTQDSDSGEVART